LNKKLLTAIEEHCKEMEKILKNLKTTIHEAEECTKLQNIQVDVLDIEAGVVELQRDVEHQHDE